MSEIRFLAAWNISILTALCLLIVLAVACVGSTPAEIAKQEPTSKEIAVDESIRQTTSISQVRFDPGTYRVGQDIAPGVYAGKTAGSGFLESCYWARWGDISGDLTGIIANDNSSGQYYVEVLESDTHLETDCAITHISEWPKQDASLSVIEPGTHIVGRDISPGMYRGTPDAGDYCYWERLSGVSGKLKDILANGMSVGTYFVDVHESDYALANSCKLERVVSGAN